MRPEKQVLEQTARGREASRGKRDVRCVVTAAPRGQAAWSLGAPGGQQLGAGVDTDRSREIKAGNERTAKGPWVP